MSRITLHGKTGSPIAVVRGLLFAVAVASAAQSPTAADPAALRLAIEDLRETFGADYPEANAYLAELHRLAGTTGDDRNERLRQLRTKALLDNPLLDFDRLIVLKRKRGQLGLPDNHLCNNAISRTGYDNEIATLSPVRPDGKLQTLYRPRNGAYVGEFDLHWDADRLLFTMPVGPTWQIHEIGTDGRDLRQVSRGNESDVDNFDPCYLPDGGIFFASTACFTGVPCWHGQQRACSLYRMDADGGNVRQLCFDQDLDLHPAVLANGQVIYSRWDYTGTMHMYMRPLMVMNPDGTGQRAVYGSNSYWPPCLFFPQAIPGAPGKVVSVLTGYHQSNREGMLALLDLTRGYDEADGVVQLIPGRGKRPEPIVKDALTAKEWPKFLHPHPLSEKYFLVSSKLDKQSPWGIYLVDVFDNMLPLLVDGEHDYFEPIAVRPRPRPPVIPDRVAPARNDAVVYLHDVYSGPGLAGVPRGTVKTLRIAAYNFGYPNLAGPDKIGLGGPWEAMQILGTVPVLADGSATFRVPANTPITLQPLDREGKAVQLMRSWFTAMPGEKVSCVGCHEKPNETALPRGTMAARVEPMDIRPWHGPARGFDFEREVQPVLDAHCAGCHDGAKNTLPDLRSEKLVEDYKGRQLNRLGAQRLHPELVERFGGRTMKYTPAYEALIPYIRRVGVEDSVEMLVPGEYHADTSPLIQMLQKGHHGVRLGAEEWDRLITWIDLNGPCHGTWNDITEIPDRPDLRRRALAAKYGGPPADPEAVPDLPRPQFATAPPGAASKNARSIVKLAVQDDVAAADVREKQIPLPNDLTLTLIRIPAGRFVMGDPDGYPDEGPRVVQIERPFWIGKFEVTNAQLRCFDPAHDSGDFMKRYPGIDGPGLDLNADNQPAVRVSWQTAAAFCDWLTERTGMPFALPTEEQWEYACRSGSTTALSFGSPDADFSPHANLADRSMSVQPPATGGVTTNLTEFRGNGIFVESLAGGDVPCIEQYDDKHVAASPVGAFKPNAWGLHDMHGNAAEWTRSLYDADTDRRVVRGGSFRDRPQRARSAFRLAFPAWQRVPHTGFRVICEVDPTAGHVARQD